MAMGVANGVLAASKKVLKSAKDKDKDFVDACNAALQKVQVESDKKIKELEDGLQTAENDVQKLDDA
jgi:ribosome recycling factor